MKETGKPKTFIQRHRSDSRSTSRREELYLPIKPFSNRVEVPRTRGKDRHSPRKIYLNLDQFNELVTRALEEIPEEFYEHLENMEIFVEDEASAELLKELGLGKEDLLLGLYQGIPKPGKSHFQGFSLPDRITLFRHPIQGSSRSRQQVLHSIKKTLVHEIAHHFGFSERRIRQLGY